MAEDEKERLDRELIELLNELRVMVTGVQMLFAFLLTVAFSQRFATVTSLQRDVYYATLLSAALASMWLIAPAVYHRLLFRHHEKQHMIFTANKMAIVGVAFLALSITGVLFLITDVLFGGAATIIVTALAFVVVLGLWFVLPLVRRGERLTNRAE